MNVQIIVEDTVNKAPTQSAESESDGKGINKNLKINIKRKGRGVHPSSLPEIVRR